MQIEKLIANVKETVLAEEITDKDSKIFIL